MQRVRLRGDQWKRLKDSLVYLHLLLQARQNDFTRSEPFRRFVARSSFQVSPNLLRRVHQVLHARPRGV